MKNLITLLFCALPMFALAQEDGFKKDIAQYLAFNKGRILELAEAIPADKYDWRPAEGIRSVKETLLHTAQVNFMGMMQMGFQPEKEMDLMNLDKMEADKAKTKEIVTESFDFVLKHIEDIPESELSDMVTFPFGEFTKRGTLMLIMEHGGEHKGQLIGYARMNGVTPPWSN